eukprot:PhM_4_TR10090/c2_g1_i1/m.19737
MERCTFCNYTRPIMMEQQKHQVDEDVSCPNCHSNPAEWKRLRRRRDENNNNNYDHHKRQHCTRCFTSEAYVAGHFKHERECDVCGDVTRWALYDARRPRQEVCAPPAPPVNVRHDLALSEAGSSINDEYVKNGENVNNNNNN